VGATELALAIPARIGCTVRLFADMSCAAERQIALTMGRAPTGNHMRRRPDLGGLLDQPTRRSNVGVTRSPAGAKIGWDA